MENPICPITGATEGIGKFTALELARKGFTVVIAVRNKGKAELVKTEIARTGNREVDYVVADLASLKEVRQLAETFKQRHGAGWGLSIALGYKAKWGAALIILFLVPVTIMIHNFWSVSDPVVAQDQMAHIMKNVSLLGSALLIFYFGSGPLSLDGRSR